MGNWTLVASGEYTDGVPVGSIVFIGQDTISTSATDVQPAFTRNFSKYVITVKRTSTVGLTMYGYTYSQVGSELMNFSPFSHNSSTSLIYDKRDVEFPAYKWYVKNDATSPVVSGETIGTGDGGATAFSKTLSGRPVQESSLTISYTIGGTDYTATDDGNGNISGTNCTGTIDYSTGALSLTFTTAPDSGTPITADYDVKLTFKYWVYMR